jgi:hypothetical protein
LLVKECEPVRLKFNYFEQFAFFGALKRNRIQTFQMNGLRFGVEIHGELIDINKGLPEMEDLIDRFRIVNKRVLGPKVSVCFIDNKSVLYRYDIKPKFQQTNVFIIVVNAYFFSLLDFYAVV